jgi:hypothetical protein
MRFDFLTPRVPRTWLLFIAAVVWTVAGGMLLFRGYLYSQANPGHLFLKTGACVLGGLVFYAVMFDKISKKHVTRISNLKIEKPCAFSFFNLRSYLLMTIMIAAGITLRKSGVMAPQNLALIYLTMGIPLLLSSFRFYTTFFRTKAGRA